MPHTTELQNWLDLANGKGELRAEIIEHTLERLRVLASKMLGRFPRVRRWAETDDVLQDSIIRLHRALAEVKPESPRQFYGLAATQIRRELIDLARKHDGPEGIGKNHYTDDGKAVRQTATKSVEPESMEAWEAFHNQVDSLPVEQREVVELVWYDGMKQPAAADVLGISLATLKRRWQAARLTLFETLKDFDFTND